jgi:hypothetical protein
MVRVEVSLFTKVHDIETQKMAIIIVTGVGSVNLNEKIVFSLWQIQSILEGKHILG